MQSSAKTVPAYLKEVPAERRAALKKLRDLCRATLTGFDESMLYGGPCYSRNGVVEVGFASQKHFIGLYILRTDVMNAHNKKAVDAFASSAFLLCVSKTSEISFGVIKILESDGRFPKFGVG